MDATASAGTEGASLPANLSGISTAPHGHSGKRMRSSCIPPTVKTDAPSTHGPVKLSGAMTEGEFHPAASSSRRTP